MSFVAMSCPSCGAPLPPEARKRTVVCAFCGASVMHDRWMAHRRDFASALEGERRAAAGRGGDRVEIGGRSYAVLGVLGAGESSEVLLAERADGVGERVVLKMLREASGAASFERSCAALTALTDAERLARRLPRLRQRGQGSRHGVVRETAVLTYECGFFQSLWDVRANHGASLDAAHAVWIWRRLLDLSASLRRAGWVHRALLPHHLLVHARDHGVLAVGWGASTRETSRLDAVVEPYADLYPPAVLAGEPFTAVHDLAMTARSVGWLLRDGDSWLPGRRTPAPIAELIVAVGSGIAGQWGGTAEGLDGELKQRAADAFGAPTYRRLEMPGWK